MHIAAAVLWPLSVLIMLIVGAFLGLLIGVFKGAELSHAYAHHLAGDCPQCSEDEDDEQDDAETDDEESRLDALTLRDLIQAVRPLAINEDVLALLQLGETTALHKALAAAEDRFDDWIEWAEEATKTKTALAAPADGA